MKSLGGVIFFLAIIFLVYLIAKGRKQKKLQQQQQPKPQTTPKITVTPLPKEEKSSPEYTFTVSYGGLEESDPSYKLIGTNEWGITTPFKRTFTLYNLPPEEMESLFGHLKNRTGSWRERTVPIEMIIHKTDLRCREIDVFLSTSKREIQLLIERLEKLPDWGELSELDRRDEISGIESDYFDNLVERPHCDLETMYYAMDSIAKADDELIAYYGVEIITPYLRSMSRTGNIQRIPASHYSREDYEFLVKRGLARRGKDIPVDEILPTLTLKEMNEIVGSTVPKPFTRKPKAIEYLLQQPNLFDLLNKSISFNQLFQTLPLDPQFAHIDLDQIAASWRYDNELASAIISGFDATGMFFTNDYHKEESIKWRTEMGLPV